MPTQQDVAQAQQKQVEQEQMRADLLVRILSPEAKERLSRIALVKPDKAKRLEEMARACSLARGRGGGREMADVARRRQRRRGLKSGAAS